MRFLDELPMVTIGCVAFTVMAEALLNGLPGMMAILFVLAILKSGEPKKIWGLIAVALSATEKPEPRRGLIEVERPRVLHGEYIPREEELVEIHVHRPRIETYIDAEEWVVKEDRKVIHLPDLSKNF